MANERDATFSARNHYVPVWYQKRFLNPKSPVRDFFYLDITPGQVKSGRHTYAPKRKRRAGPNACFWQRHLYTTYFGGRASDYIERYFFGAFDRRAPAAVSAFANYSVREETHRLWHVLLRHLSAQKLRTPRGLNYLHTFVPDASPDAIVAAMVRMADIHCTIWAEGVWEILECKNSETKFLLTDHPVVTYNKSLFPESADCRYPKDASIDKVGTHTIYPLDLDHCLVITNLQYVRDSTLNRKKTRTNARCFEQTLFDLRSIQSGREIPEEWVIAINYISKMRARQFIAAHEEDWLYPEKRFGKTRWDEIGGRFFLMPDPRKVSFTTGIVVGMQEGPAWVMDEYGRGRIKDTRAEHQRKSEWATFQREKARWDHTFGPLSPSEVRKSVFGFE